MHEVTIASESWSRIGVDASRVREAVFIRELGVDAPLVSDEADTGAVHVVAYRQGEAIAAARLLPDGAIGRLAVLPCSRREGIGSRLLRTLIEHAARRGDPCVRLYAQGGAVSFYLRHGFATVGESFYEGGVEHIEMVRPLALCEGRG